MAVKILISRKVAPDKIIELTELLKELRSLTIPQPGYISGETLRRIDRKDESLVISTWRSVEDWERWVNNDRRGEIQGQIDALLGEKTEYAIYES